MGVSNGLAWGLTVHRASISQSAGLALQILCDSLTMFVY